MSRLSRPRGQGGRPGREGPEGKAVRSVVARPEGTDRRGIVLEDHRGQQAYARVREAPAGRVALARGQLPSHAEPERGGKVIAKAGLVGGILLALAAVA